ncbi:GntR family transcriptional regulator [Nocardioides sp. YIM 152315]|nr:GntR family transcriptional regulator [Nocardioides sp. YIM 152315]
MTEELHRAVTNGELAAGSGFSIVELCEMFGVSHIPVREALRRLESEGLVTLRPGRSALVTSLSSEELSGIYRLRRIIEGDVVLRAMTAMSEEHLERARAMLDELVGTRPDPAEVAASNRAFHLAILEEAATGADRRVLDILWRLTDRYLHLLADGGPGALSGGTWVDEHRAMLELARGGDAHALRDAWVAHLDAAESTLQAALARLPQ